MNEAKERALRSIYECITIAVRTGNVDDAREMARNAAIIERQVW